MKNGIKQYFDEPAEIVGWIAIAIGVALSIIAIFTELLDSKLAALGSTIAVGGASMVSAVVRKYVKLLAEALEKQADKRTDKAGEE